MYTVQLLFAHGSSPRSRGTDQQIDQILFSDRFIPALAGNGPVHCHSSPAPTVHPRARGERVSGPTITPTQCGSSPRSRGTGLADYTAEGVGRFIPALAGNGLAIAALAFSKPVHPRARGERSTGTTIAGDYFGSSPRSRGTGSHALRSDCPYRFIPALAGNGRIAVSPCVVVTVHPRARGERRRTPLHHIHTTGSSPRSRGTVTDTEIADYPVRFIPALAGNGPSVIRSGMTCTVHPRARGERCTHWEHGS